ncbi:ribosomal protein L1 [Tritrichomonas foetus]|uniref:Ribosomal protein L1 n=1 Tax=Tritrichomonas foetus TaxID=1144522 RepID=A0A1J4KYV3_9EUKA|nr:ribosomal protein L1 [Tritrichomonas foetus]|eukprot:OHT16056.1 ribosomal protein L1 [Tritrichomonas foetus]
MKLFIYFIDEILRLSNKFKGTTTMSQDLHSQISKAFAVLQTLEKKSEEELIPDDPNVTLRIQLWEPYNGTSAFPVLFPIRHSLFADSTLPVRIITKDPQKEWSEKFKEAFPPFPIKVYSIEKWRKRFTRAADRRQLIKETRIFMADRRVGHVISDILGADFYEKKKTPVLVNLEKEDILEDVKNVFECTMALLPKGYKFAAPIGQLSWSAEDIADNGCDAINGIFEKIGQEKVASISIGTPGSLLIPVYSADISSVINQP